jgi:hypothetical protein
LACAGESFRLSTNFAPEAARPFHRQADIGFGYLNLILDPTSKPFVFVL